MPKTESFIKFFCRFFSRHGSMREYTEHTWVFRQAGCVLRVSGQGAPPRRSGPYGEEAQRRPGARGA
ncbi:hypothetical protein, partial [Thiocapsa sp.]|uniref:hypothetical protein n=1 Tax=Thiocapsa sp. TaxID=2024551 RepID=UPI002B887D17